MKSKKEIENNPTHFDIKAETIISAFRELRDGKDDVFVRFNGQHKRSWSKDVSHIETKKFEKSGNALVYHLNRDGIYDALPEALFHKVSQKSNQDGEEMAKSSALLKKEEIESRRFFMPFENAIFDKKVEIATKENQLFQNIFSNLLTGILPDFWLINQDVPKEMAYRLAALLPYAHQTVGDLELTAQCLSFVMHETVKVYKAENKLKIDTKQINSSIDKLGWSLGLCNLGADSICGKPNDNINTNIVVEIGPLRNIEAKDCLQHSAIDKLLNDFYQYFLPMEWEVETKNFFKTETRGFMLHEDTEKADVHIGFNMRI